MPTPTMPPPFQSRLVPAMPHPVQCKPPVAQPLHTPLDILLQLSDCPILAHGVARPHATLQKVSRSVENNYTIYRNGK